MAARIAIDLNLFALIANAGAPIETEALANKSGGDGLLIGINMTSQEGG